ncbi:MAG: PH domain-containing protein [Lachnospiraceae bacterium]|nr:PH domain-containing protein [Lachnospiraceae bacterium]
MGFVERKRWLFLGLPWTFTKYTVTEDVLTIDEGLINTKENDCYMYKITDVELDVSLMERICGLGTIKCITGDKTHPVLLIKHIKHSKDVKNYILEESEKARIRRRTVNMQDIGGADLALDDMDDVDMS